VPRESQPASLVDPDGSETEVKEQRMRRGLACIAGLLLVTALTAGCTTTAKDPTSVTPTPTTRSATPTPTPTPTGGAQNPTDPTLGIVFAPAPDLQGDEADVYNLIAAIEHEAWSMMVTGKVSPAFDALTSAEVQAQAQASVAGIAQHGYVYGGVLHVQIGSIVVNGATATGSACRDYAKATFADATRTYSPDEAGVGEPSLMEMTLARDSASGLWKVMTIKENGTC
jgi:hypothetical protein